MGLPVSLAQTQLDHWVADELNKPNLSWSDKRTIRKVKKLIEKTVIGYAMQPGRWRKPVGVKLYEKASHLMIRGIQAINKAVAYRLEEVKLYDATVLASSGCGCFRMQDSLADAVVVVYGLEDQAHKLRYVDAHFPNRGEKLEIHDVKLVPQKNQYYE